MSSAQSKETTERRGTSGSVVQAYAVMSGTVSRWLRNERGRNGWLLVHTLRDKHGATTGQACYWIWREMTLQGPWGTMQSTTFRNKLALSRKPPVSLKIKQFFQQALATSALNLGSGSIIRRHLFSFACTLVFPERQHVNIIYSRNNLSTQHCICSFAWPDYIVFFRS